MSDYPQTVMEFRDQFRSATDCRAALRASEDKYRLIFDASRDAILLLRAPGWNLEAGNPAALTMFGMESQADLSSRPVWEMSPEYQPDGWRSIDKAQYLVETAMRTGNLAFEWMHRRPDGQEFLCATTLDRVSCGGLPALQVSIRDITRQRADEQLLRETAGLLQAIPDTVLRIRSDGTLLYCQRARGGTDLLTPAGSSDPASVLACDPHGLLPVALATGRQSLVRTRPVVTETVLSTRTGDIQVEMRAAPSGEDEFVVLVRDITDRRRLELLLSTALARERESSAMKDRFISVVSHELRSPMSVAMAAVDVLSGHGDRLSPARRQRLLASIDHAMQQMSSMLDGLLALDRVTSRRLQANITGVDLRELAETIIKEMRLIDGHAHRFNLKSAGNCARILSDGDILRHILTNLLTNAVRYSPCDSLVTIHISCEATGFELAVRDMGIGIPLADRDRILQPFERGSNTTGITGVGLGLCIAKEMVGLLGGSLRFTSAPGEGTVFTVKFPQPP